MAQKSEENEETVEEMELDYVMIGSDGEEMAADIEDDELDCGPLCKTLKDIGIPCSGHQPVEAVKTEGFRPLVEIDIPRPPSSPIPFNDYSNVEDLLVTLKIKIAAMKKESRAKDELIAQQLSLLELQKQILKDLQGLHVDKD